MHVVVYQEVERAIRGWDIDLFPQLSCKEHGGANAYIERQSRQGGMSEPAPVEEQDAFSADHEDEEVLTDEELEEEDEEL